MNLRLENLGTVDLGSAEKKAGARNRIVRYLKSLAEETKQAAIEILVRQCGATVPEGLGRSLMLSWEEVREMAASGISFGAHGETHAILTNVPKDRARREMTQSKAEIEDRTGRPVLSFSWPDGKFSPDLTGMARAVGYVCAVSSKPYARRRPLRVGDDIYALGRLETHDLDKTRILLSGLAGDAEMLLRGSRP
jgi:hypothetical protein